MFKTMFSSIKLHKMCKKYFNNNKLMFFCHKRRSSSLNANTDNNKNCFFITTPIFYVNGEPHIGHLYSATLADALHRFHLLLGTKNTLFSTGTDEHGIKIQRAAAQQSIEPKLFCDKYSNIFKSLFESVNLTNTHFIRTTDETHKKAVEHFWNSLMSSGYIYKSSYEGWYCISDETFVTEAQVVENDNKIKVSIESGNPVEWTKEDNYIFKLSHFSKSLLELVNSKQFVKPSVFNEFLKKNIESGLHDISVSRPKSRLQWGIEVPNDETQTIYVWLDALINYLTVAGYPNANFVWPPDCQVIGKDILRFHGIYWPAFLMAVGLEPPRSLLCHSHWLVDDVKMSKSKGNVINPFEKMKLFSCDGFRYFLLREDVLYSDGNINDKKVQQYLNTELADTLGNLLARSTAPALNKNQIFPSINVCKETQLMENEAYDVVNELKDLADHCRNHYSDGNFYLGIIKIMDCLRLTNLFFQKTKPWELVKDKGNDIKLQAVLCIALEVLRVSGILLQPVVPKIADHLLNKLNISRDKRYWADATQTFNDNCIENNVKYLNSGSSVIFKKLKELKE